MNAPVERITPGDGSWDVAGKDFSHKARQVVLCAPADHAAKLVGPWAAPAARALEAIPYAPVAVVHLAFKKDQVGQPRPGFGFLAALIGYLPTIYQAFSRRETNISLLDARAGSPPSAMALSPEPASTSHTTNRSMRHPRSGIYRTR